MEEREEEPPVEAPRKKPYSRPEVKRVPLRPEEAVLGACKTSGVSGPAAADCTFLGCSSIGS